MLKPVYLQSGRIFGLDVIRCLAILLVLVNHSLNFCKPFIHKDILELLSGTIGVELFFCLSGFLIGGILLKMLTMSPTFDALTFWKRRWYRTLPLFWFVLIVHFTCGLLAWHQSLTAQYAVQFLKYLLFVQNIVTPNPIFYGVAWSLSVEEWSYIILPVLVIILTLRFDKISGPQIYVRAITILLVLAFLARASMAFVMNSPSMLALFPGKNVSNQFLYGVRLMVIFRLDAIAYGALFAYLWRFKGDELIAKRATLLSASSVCALMAIAMSLTLSKEPNPFYIIFCFPLYGISFSMLLIWALALKRPTRSPQTVHFVEYISLTSYSIYLIHWVLLTFFKLYFPFTTVFNHVVGISLFLGLTYIISVQTYNYIEYPILEYRDRVTRTNNELVNVSI